MKQIIRFVFTLIVLSSCHQIQGSGNIVTENRSTGNFTGISAGSAFEVELKTGPATEVRVEADDNLMKYIETRVSGNVLHISTKSRTSILDGHYKVFVTSPEINYINSSGAASVHIINVIKNDEKIKLEASGAASINGEVDAPKISADASGAANIAVSGRTMNYNAEASGSATIKTSELMSETTKVHASGAANAHVFVSVSLDADASGAANIHYKGSGNIVQKTSGAASVKKDD
jgi:hypothetical protein